jgi:hypothetical protein
MFVLRKQHTRKLDQVSISNCTVKGHVSEMSKDSLDKVVADLKASLYFAPHLDESTDFTSSEQLTCVFLVHKM